MTLVYRFKKEKIENRFVVRPKILVTLHGPITTLDVPALIDSGCDVSVIPESLAKAIGIEIKGNEHKLHAFRESSDVIETKTDITFVGKERRQSVTFSIPLLVVLSKEGQEDEPELVLGIEGIFDHFDLTFQKNKNKIKLKSI